VFNSFAANLTQWQWVALAWGQLIVFYAGYLFYLNRRYKQAKEKLEEASSSG
jgi:hypothetical protein